MESEVLHLHENYKKIEAQLRAGIRGRMRGLTPF
ncbi:hypothetical protein SEEN176_12083 [Salmonella enterica subsp. enterica serovar Newport str. CVM 4176]|nr:hypothetical protein SEEN176_12083 [Salmonella enterica subsp. enterica serovar Newport str. CVM 4176]